MTAYVGVPGSGKSLHVMDDLYWICRRKDALVMCNFDVSFPRGARAAFFRLPSGEVSVSDVMEGVSSWLAEGNCVTHEGQIFVVIDEAQITFNNRDWQKPGRAAWIRLFIQHRKLGMRFVLVVQDLGMLDKQIRAVVETCGNHMRVNTYGWFGSLVGLLFLGRPVCMCVYRLPFYGASKAGVIGRRAVIGSRRLYRMYDTHAIFSDDLLGVDVWDSSVPSISRGPVDPS